MAKKIKLRVDLASLARSPIRSTTGDVQSAHSRLLLEVASKLRRGEIEELRFFIRDIVSDETAAEALTAFSILECLERHGYGHSIQTYLVSSGRKDLVNILANTTTHSCPGDKNAPSLIGRDLSPQASTPVWPYSTFRKCAVEIFSEMTEDEVKQFRWLSQDLIPDDIRRPWLEEITGVELLTTMEKSKLIGPANYSLLIEWLHDINRPDLAHRILPPSLLLKLPGWMNLPALLHQKHLDMIQLKKTQYRFGMRYLMTMQTPSKITAQHARGYYQRIVEVLSPRPLKNHTKILETLPDTLINLSLYLNDLFNALRVYECSSDSAAFHQSLLSCNTHLTKLLNLMEMAEWDCIPRKKERASTSRQYHPVRQASYGAFAGLSEFLLEFSLNREKFQQESRELSSTLERLELLLSVCGFMWSLTSWLVALLEVAICSPVSLEKYQLLLRILVIRNMHMIDSNSKLIMSVLHASEAGRGLAKRRKFKVVDQTFHPFQAAAIPIALFGFVLLLLSDNCSLSLNDTKEILASLRKFIAENEDTFCGIYHQMTTMVLNDICRNVEAFRSAKLSEFASHNMHSVEELFMF